MNEGRRGFFRGLFGGRGPEEPAAPPELIEQAEHEADLDITKVQDQLKPETEQHAMVGRRNFLKGAGALFAVGLAEQTISKATAVERKDEIRNLDSSVNDKKYTAADGEKPKDIEAQERQEITTFLEELGDFSKERKVRAVSRESRKTADLDQLHHEFVARFGDKVPEMLNRMVKYNMNDIIPVVYEILQQTDSLGLYYKFVSNTPDKYHVYPKVDASWPEDKFQSRAKDYLPTGREIEDYEIDPRFLQIVKRNASGAYEYQDVELVRETLSKFPGWADQDRMLAFRAVLDDAAVRDLFSQTDCSLAEVYSVIKAAIKIEGTEAYPTVYESRINELLKSREEFKLREIIGSHTKHFIHFTSTDATVFDPKIAEQIGGLVTIWNKRDDHVEKRIDNELQGHYKQKKGAGDPIVTSFERIVGGSTGETVLYLSTHGEPNSLELYHDDPAKAEGLTVTDLANCLALRLNNTKDARSLGEMTIMLNSCSSHNFAENLIKEIRGRYEGDQKDIELISMPTIISSAQEGSLAYNSGILKDTMNKYLKAIASEGKLTGEFLLRRIQPDSYIAGDITVFTQQTQQKWMEIGQQEKEQKSAAV